MGKPYSLALHKRVVSYVTAGHSCRAAGRIFGVSALAEVRAVSEHRSRGNVSVKPQGRPADQFGKLAPHMDFLVEIVHAEPDITLAKFSNALEDTFGLRVQLSSIHRALQRAGFSYKKGLIAKERDRPALRWERAEWINRCQPRMRLAPHWLVCHPRFLSTAGL